MRRISAFVLVALVALAVAGCKKTVRSSTDVALVLKGFPYPMQLFTPATLDLASGGGQGFVDKFPWYHWRFKTKGSYADVVAFYDAQLSFAARELDQDEQQDPEHGTEPQVSWTYRPDGAQDPDEKVCVSVERTPDKIVTYTVAWSAPAERLPH
jgi:hypothetical protein